MPAITVKTVAALTSNSVEELALIFLTARTIEYGVPVHKCTQDVNTFIVTFPRAYHAGFSTGVSIALTYFVLVLASLVV